MLILARKVGERIKLMFSDGTEGWITVTDIEYNCKVRLGFEFQPDVKIVREELLPFTPTKEQ